MNGVLKLLMPSLPEYNLINVILCPPCHKNEPSLVQLLQHNMCLTFPLLPRVTFNFTSTKLTTYKNFNIHITPLDQIVLKIRCKVL